MRPDAAEHIAVSPLSEVDALRIVKWRYDPGLSVYDLGAADVDTMLEPRNRYFAIWRRDELVGHVCVGVEARVSGLAAEPGVDDIGIGLRPDLVGRGNARRMLPAVLAALGTELRGSWLRVAVASWNVRAQAAAQALGFERVGEHRNTRGCFVLLTRRWP